MFWLKNIAILSLIFQKLCQTQEWKAINPSYTLQHYKEFLNHKYQNNKEPWVATPIIPLKTNIIHKSTIVPPHLKAVQQVTIPNKIENVDFRKPKTLSVHKTVLSSSHSPIYEFQYKVDDPKENNYQEKYEARVGDSVKGHYSVREPNGYMRLVKYVSDKDGFRAEVSHHQTDHNGVKSYVLTSMQRST